MNKRSGVQKRHPRANVLQDAPQRALIQRPPRPLKPMPQVPPGEELHHQDQAVLQRRNRPENSHDVGVRHPLHRLHFAEKGPVLPGFHSPPGGGFFLRHTTVVLTIHDPRVSAPSAPLSTVLAPAIPASVPVSFSASALSPATTTTVSIPTAANAPAPTRATASAVAASVLGPNADHLRRRVESVEVGEVYRAEAAPTQHFARKVQVGGEDLEPLLSPLPQLSLRSRQYFLFVGM